MTCLVAASASVSTGGSIPQAPVSSRSSRSSLQQELDAMFLRPTSTSNRGVAPAAIMIPIMIRAFSPLPPLLSFVLPANTTVAWILVAIIRQLRLPARVAQMLRLTRLGGQTVTGNTSLTSLAGPPMRNAYGQWVQPPITLEVRMAMPGGKGGFGSQLRAAGGKMSASRNGGEENRDSCRDLNGRRLSTIKQAQQLAAYMATEQQRTRALSEAQRKKYEKLERMLGRKPRGEADFVEAAHRLHDEGEDLGDEEEEEEGEAKAKGEGFSRLPNRPVPSDSDEASLTGKGKKRQRIDDPEYVEQSRAIVNNVRSAVATAMLKRKKKQAQATSAAALSTASTTTPTSTSAQTA